MVSELNFGHLEEAPGTRGLPDEYVNFVKLSCVHDTSICFFRRLLNTEITGKNSTTLLAMTEENGGWKGHDPFYFLCLQPTVVA